MLLLKYKDIFTRKFKAQKTTTRRTGIIVVQQCICHMQVDNTFQFLHDNNTGTLLDGRTFCEDFEYFLLGGDETCCIALDGNVHVVGGKDNRKEMLITPFFACIYFLPRN